MLRTQISVTSRQQQQQQPSSPCPPQQMMWFPLFQHCLSPHHAVSPSGNLHTQYQPPPESAAHSVRKTVSLEQTSWTHHPHTHTRTHTHTLTFTHLALTFTHSHLHTLSLSALPHHNCHQSCSPLVPQWIVLLCVRLHHHSIFRNLTVEGC